MPSPGKLLVVDGHPMICRGFESCCAGEDFISEVHTAASARVARDICRQRRPSLLVVDLELPDMSGCDLIRSARQTLPDTKVLAYTARRSDIYLPCLRKMRVDAVISKTASVARVLSILRLVWQGFNVLPRSSADDVDSPFERLTAREMSVAERLIRGEGNGAIAKRLNLSPKTIAVHKMNVMRKLRAGNLADLFLLGSVYGVCDPGGAGVYEGAAISIPDEPNG